MQHLSSSKWNAWKLTSAAPDHDAYFWSFSSQSSLTYFTTYFSNRCHYCCHSSFSVSNSTLHDYKYSLRDACQCIAQPDTTLLDCKLYLMLYPGILPSFANQCIWDPIYHWNHIHRFGSALQLSGCCLGFICHCLTCRLWLLGLPSLNCAPTKTDMLISTHRSISNLTTWCILVIITAPAHLYNHSAFVV